MVDVVCELLLVFRIKSEHLYQTLHVDAFQIAIGKSAHVAARLDDEVAGCVRCPRSTTCPLTGGLVLLQVEVYVTAYQIALP